MAEFIVEKMDALQIWTINGEARRNSIRRAMVQEFDQLTRRITDHREARVVIITGAGEKAFCAGADLKERAGMAETDVRTFLGDLRQMFRRLETGDCIFIAAINGLALGGGTELALCCDLRVASPSAELGLTEVKLGIIPGGGGTQRLSRLIGVGHAKDLILTGRRVGAAEALSLGLVNRVAPEGKLKETAIELAKSILENGPIAVASAKHAIDEGAALPLDEALGLELRHYDTVLRTEDRLEGLKAFSEKRKPTFKGK